MATGFYEVTKPAANEVLLITSGDLRQSANQVCWPAQRDMEEKLTAAFAQKGCKLVRAHAYDDKVKHGFISSQRQGMDVFMKIHPRGDVLSLPPPRGSTAIMSFPACAATRAPFSPWPTGPASGRASSACST